MSSPRPFQYRLLFAVCLLVMLSLALPGHWHRLASPGYLLLALVMIFGLGQPLHGDAASDRSRHLYRMLGGLTVLSGLRWSLTALSDHRSGIPLIVLWSLFSVWSCLRLIRRLARERQVSAPVLIGASAGYLMLGLTAGLLCGALETIQPGSFTNLHAGHPLPTDLAVAGRSAPVWTISFVRLNYYAFVSLTTMGYGDVLPATPLAQMLGVAIALMGTFYVAVVMGLLISRLIAQERPQL